MYLDREYDSFEYLNAALESVSLNLLKGDLES